MLRRIFHFLALFTLFSMICCGVFLFYRKDSYIDFATVRYPITNVFSKLKDYTQELEVRQETTTMQESSYNETTKMPIFSSNKTMAIPATSKKTLEACPNTPPQLVGPLHVEFNTKRTLDEVRKEVGSPLQNGGRYKPLDCISQHKVAIIIPFRNRYEHLTHWLYYLHPILIRQQLDYGVYVINQDGDGVFNRAKLMNVGYLEALKEYDYECFIFSDIDLVPLDDRNIYRCFDNPRHLAVAMDKFNFHLPYNTYFGGVSSLSKQQFLKINGFPNTYWGWGGEDDDIYRRVIFHGMSISRPDSVTGKYRMIKHERDLHNEPNPKNPGKLSKTQSTMHKDGLNSLNYAVKGVVKDLLYTFVTVDIQAPPK